MTQKTMDWNKLLSAERLDNSKFYTEEFPGAAEARKRLDYTSFEDDYQRILSSSAFRALQDKTQVFSLDKSDYIRTRLTHSLEVSTIARIFGGCIRKSVESNKKELPGLNEAKCDQLAHVLAAAGLLHDMGNPPFGHRGETAISNWLTANLQKKLECRGLECANVDDLAKFEGNAQTFRMLCGGMRGDELELVAPTYAVLGATIKYTTDCAGVKSEGGVELHKPGYYASDREAFEKIAQKTGTLEEAGGKKTIRRHPLAFLLEAADDIAYRTADFEDAINKGLITAAEIEQYDEMLGSFELDSKSAKKTGEIFEKLLQLMKENPSHAAQAVHYWISQTRWLLINSASFVWVANYDQIMCGKYHSALLENDAAFHKLTMAVLGKYMKEFVYDSTKMNHRERYADVILGTLLDTLIDAALDQAAGMGNDAQPTVFERYVSPATICSLKQSTEGKPEGDVTYEYIRVAIDAVSNLTDSAAESLFRELADLR